MTIKRTKVGTKSSTKVAQTPALAKAKAVQAGKAAAGEPLTTAEAEKGSGVVPARKAAKGTVAGTAAKAKPAAAKVSKRAVKRVATKRAAKAVKPARSTALKAPAGLMTQAQLAKAAKVSLPTASKYRQQLKAHHVKSTDGRAVVLYKAAAVPALRALRDEGLGRRGVYERA